MDKLSRIYKLHELLKSRRRPVPMGVLQAELEYSRATVKRIIGELRDIFAAPLEYDRKNNGYHYAANGEHPFELPGLWFSAAELHALLAAEKLLADLQPGWLQDKLIPLRQRMREILAAGKTDAAAELDRIRILAMASRQQHDRHFHTVATAVINRRRLRIDYYSRAKDERTERVVSPQRLTHYRDNWYLDAWCHRTQALRTFALDAIEAAELQESRAKEISAAKLDAHYAAGYGIFAGKPKATAVLRFSPNRARWVARERWHPEQRGQFLPDGRYELSFPYSDPRELIMDVLKHGAEVEVIGPPDLRTEIAAQLAAACRRYGQF